MSMSYIAYNAYVYTSAGLKSKARCISNAQLQAQAPPAKAGRSHTRPSAAIFFVFLFFVVRFVVCSYFCVFLFLCVPVFVCSYVFLFLFLCVAMFLCSCFLCVPVCVCSYFFVFLFFVFLFFGFLFFVLRLLCSYSRGVFHVQIYVYLYTCGFSVRFLLSKIFEYAYIYMYTYIYIHMYIC